MSRPPKPDYRQLRSDQVAAWMAAEVAQWTPAVPRMMVWASINLTNPTVLAKLNRELTFDGFRFVGIERFDAEIVNAIAFLSYEGDLGHRSGAYRFRFEPIEAGDPVEALVVCAHYSEEGNDLFCLASIPETFRIAWTQFGNEINRLTYSYDERVVVIGGRQDSFEPTVRWDEIILPEALKRDLLEDVHAFFTKGTAVYKRLNLKPFRKLLLAGVPGTGKTMICNALAKWALEQKYMAIYISGAKKVPGDPYGSTFHKIHHALDVASRADRPTLMILEELDAYLHDEDKALILNVLDGSESVMNEHGTLMVATTNYPEAIDERVLKRPGRLDRVFIIPQTRSEIDAGEMLQRYLGAMWNEQHRALVPKLVGYPGAFIREVAIFALTQVAYDDLAELPLALLTESFERLRAQIDARDDFLRQRAAIGFAAPDGARGNGSHN
jgi:DNA polymerase III delta prime subunit